MKVLVLGAGVVGTTTAWYLSREGCEVTVIDRQPDAGMETSRANGGQVSVSHAEPWAAPGVPAKALRWMLSEDAPILVRPRLDAAQWRWLGLALRECTPERYRANLERLVRLGRYSRAELRALRAETGIAYAQLARGILHFYTDAAAFRASQRTASLMRSQGAAREHVDADEAIRIEPALAPVRERLAGASFTADDESGDAHLFTRRLAELAAARGARFAFGLEVTRLVVRDGRFEGIEARPAQGAPDGACGAPVRSIQADAVVVALGSFSPRLLAPLGIAIPVYPVKGYSITVPVRDPARTPTVSLTDEQYKLVMSRLGARLRIAGTAEFAGHDASVNRRRCEVLLRRGRDLFGDALDWERAELWAGLRPATPSNVPHIGRTRIAGLFLNTGHGTLGWTHACGSARLLADRLCGRAPSIEWPEDAERPGG